MYAIQRHNEVTPCPGSLASISLFPPYILWPCVDLAYEGPDQTQPFPFTATSRVSSFEQREFVNGILPLGMGVAMANSGDASSCR